MSRFLVGCLLAQQSPQGYQRRRRHTTAWLALLTEHRAPPSASYLKGRSQFHCVGAYTAAGELVAKSYGAGRTRFSLGHSASAWSNRAGGAPKNAWARTHKSRSTLVGEFIAHDSKLPVWEFESQPSG
jgi:hypothetical protein